CRSSSSATPTACAARGRRRRRRRWAASWKQPLHPGDQLLVRERLGDIGVGAERQPALDPRLARRRVLAHAPADLEAVAARHHHVEQQEVGPELLRQPERLLAVARHPHLVAAAAHQELERDHDARLVLRDQHPHAALPSLASPTSGRVNEKHAPCPGRLSTQRRPPECSMMRRLMYRPRPLPCGLPVSGSPAWRNFSKIRSWCSALIPGPLSRTSTRRKPASSASAISTRPCPGSMNLTALDSRLTTTCTMRSRSARTLGTRPGRSHSRRTLRSRNSWLVEAAVSSITSRRSSSDSCHSTRPDSRRETSSTWPMRRVRRSVSLITMPRKRSRSAAGSCGLSCRISVNERIAVSGVRSSCDTVETNSSFIRSSSVRRSFAARSSCVARCSSCDFCSRRWLVTTICD